MTCNTEIENVLVFKTNIKNDLEYSAIRTTLDLNQEVKEWNVDREDIDCVLRIKSDTLTKNKIIELINNEGFTCKELD